MRAAGMNTECKWDPVSADCGSSKGLTQEVLALESGVTRNVLIHVEHGRRGLLYEWLFDIAEVLGVSAGSLLDEHEQN
ncbi:helix-turn-helix domain-containing protein [Rhodococcus sp. ARC_M6]|nr:helix-turn-helix domain-containing protein [Rhodococcus sp. ARC_M6]